MFVKDHVKSVLRIRSAHTFCAYVLRRLTFQWSGPDRWNVTEYFASFELS